MENPKQKSGFFLGITYGLVGALTAVLGFVPLAIFSAYLLNYLLFTLLQIGNSANTDDFLIAIFAWIPAAGLGLVGGWVGAALAVKRHGKIGPFAGAILGGLTASLLISLLMSSLIYRSWINRDQDYQAREMRPKVVKAVPSLNGDFQELTTISSFESLAVSPSGRMLAIATNRKIQLWDINRKTKLDQVLVGHTSTINGLAFSSDEHWLVSGSHDQKVIVWSIPDGKPVFTLEGHHAVITSVAVNPDSSLAASADGDGIVILWDLVKGQEIVQLVKDGNFINCLGFSPDGKLLATCTGEIVGTDAITLWDVNQRKEAGSLKLPNWSNGTVYDLSFSPDGKLLAGAAIFGPVVWDMETRSPIGTTEKLDTNLHIDFSPDSRVFVFTSGTTIYIYDANTVKPIATIEGPPSDSAETLFLPNGQLLAYYWTGYGSAQVGIWDVKIPSGR